MSFRPQSIAEIADRVTRQDQGFDLAMREFLDSAGRMSAVQLEAAISSEPVRVDAIRDAYLAAVAEHLALSHRVAVPGWCEAPDRFLSEPFFAGGLDSLKAILLVESPLAFRRRLIFISANALSRPHGQDATVPYS